MSHRGGPAGAEEISRQREIAVGEDLEALPSSVSDHPHPVQTGLAVAPAGLVLEQHSF